MKILVTGSSGLLGSEIKKIYHNYNFDWIFSSKEQLDLLNSNNISTILSEINPDIIINCAAFTDVDAAEIYPELANKLNCKAVECIAKWSYLYKCKLIHISTDYVFEGKLSRPLKENDFSNPISIYGKTKLCGENMCIKNNPNSIIIRTSRLFSEFGNNFLKKMLKLMKQNNQLKIIDDQFSSPTYAYDLAKAILQIINYRRWIPGIYHYSNNYNISWFDYALIIKKITKSPVEIENIDSVSFYSKNIRPNYSFLDVSKIKNTYNIIIPNFIQSLEKCIFILRNDI